MITIPIQVSGNIWGNLEFVRQMLERSKHQRKVVLDLCSEGPSLHRIGLIKLLAQFEGELDVSITQWSNSVEEVPYPRIRCNSNSHFFPMSHHYWVDEISNTVPAEFRFGLFQGRGCPSRNRILHDAATLWNGQFLLSKMSSLHGNIWGEIVPLGSVSIETLDEWFDDVDHAHKWQSTFPVGSIDNFVLQDQFLIPEVSAGKMAQSLMQHYPRFNVELICETYTLGDTFFPTEKTVRPIVGNRPFILYGPKNYLNNLQQKHGFQTFGNLWDESYDQLEGVARWNAMSKLITDLTALPDLTWQEIINRALPITQHNRNIVRKIIRDIKGI